MSTKQPQKRSSTSYKKGTTGNKRGRPKGSLNKTTARTKATIEMVMDNLAETIIDDLAEVNSSRRLQVYIDLMNYIKPKLSSTKNENSNEVKGNVNINVNFKKKPTNNPDEGGING